MPAPLFKRVGLVESSATRLLAPRSFDLRLASWCIQATNHSTTLPVLAAAFHYYIFNDYVQSLFHGLDSSSVRSVVSTHLLLPEES